MERHERRAGRDMLGNPHRQRGLPGLGAHERSLPVRERQGGRVRGVELYERLVLERRLQLVGPLGQAPFVDEQRGRARGRR